MPFPFQVSSHDLANDIGTHVQSVFAGLSSDFIFMPKGEGFVDLKIFEQGYEALKKATAGFEELNATAIVQCITETPIALVVLRTMLGFTPPELAYTTTTRTKVEVSQGFARSLDREVRLAPTETLKLSELKADRLRAMVETVNGMLVAGVPEDLPKVLIHRLDKIDTQAGLLSLQTAAKLGIPYATLLYERFLGRPFAGHRDSVSDLVGEALEIAIERQLDRYGVSYYKTRRAEKVPGFKQTPDFIIPSWNNPLIVIEAKVTEDDGTARDKVTRMINLVNLSKDQTSNPRGYQVVAALSGRGFAVREQDMENLLLATGGKVFTLATIKHLVENTDIKKLATRKPDPDAEDETVDPGDPRVLGAIYEGIALRKVEKEAAKEAEKAAKKAEKDAAKAAKKASGKGRKKGEETGDRLL